MLSDVQRELLSARLRAGRAVAPPAGIPRRAAGRPVPASYGQEQLWFLDRFAPGLANYNIGCGLRLRGRLDVPALARAIDAFVARQEGLRTRFVTDPAGRPLQQIDPALPGTLPLLDLSELDPDQRLDRLTAAAGAELAIPFDLAAGPLFRRQLVRLAEHEHVLIIVVHHIVFDGWSFGVLLRELPALYQAELTGVPAELAELPIQYADYAVWEREQLTGEALEKSLSYWRGQLADLPLVPLQTDRPRPPLESHRGAVAQLALEPQVIADARALAAAEGSTLFVTLLSALQVLLARYTGQRDLVVGTPSANRGRAELASLVGYLVNTLPIRIDCSQDPSFSELIRRVHRTTLAGYAHQELPLAKLVDALQTGRDASRAPLFQIAFSHAETESEAMQLPGLTIDSFDGYPEPDLAKFDLSFFVGTGSSGAIVKLEYATDLFDAATAERMLDHFGRILVAAVADPGLTINELPMLSEHELYAELIEWNDTDFPVAVSTVPELFAEQVSRTPAAVAVLDGESALSYAELQADVHRVAGWLAGQQVRSGDLVGIAMGPSARRLAVVLGVLAAGAGYVPLDPALPIERLSFMASDAAVVLIVADQPVLEGLSGLAAPARCLPAEWNELATDPPPASPAPDSIAYVIFTSGSTGRPKGVIVEHRNVVNQVSWMIRHCQVGVGDRVLQFASLSFDVSVQDMFTALLSGATAVIADRDTRMSPPRLTELMRRTRVSVVDLPPAVLGLLDVADLPDLRVLISGGEQLPAELALAWLRPGLQLVNAYGPTEATVNSTAADVDGTVLPPPIGRPAGNYRNYVLDPELNPVPIGALGELYIGGAGVSRGYLNQPELTAERFISDPFSADAGGRLYKSGDLVKRLPDGQIVFVGRVDDQIKLRGLRIELGEIERALLSHPAVTQAVVLLWNNPNSGPELVGYYCGDVTAEQLAEHLAGWLPAYMIPARLLPVASFSLNSSGKIDKRALPDPDPEPIGQQAPIAPVGRTETVLCELYGRLVGQDRLGATSSFFDVGGNSLLAMQLLGLIRDELGVDVAIADVFLAPSVRQLAARIDARGAGAAAAAAASVIVELSASVAEQPLILLHAVGGTVFSYAGLAAELSSRYRVYGVQSPMLLGQHRAVGDLAELAASYLRELRTVQPNGPYRLGGWSLGGVLAYELTKQLERLGDRVELLVLLDPPFQLGADRPDPDQLAAEFVADALRSTGQPAPRLDPVGSDQLLDQLASRLGADRTVRTELDRRLAAFTLHHKLMAGYRPAGPVRAPAVLIGADRSPNVAAQPHWEAVLPGLQRHLVPADHYSLLGPELVGPVARLVEKAQFEADEPA